jgi:hypothetical protein
VICGAHEVRQVESEFEQNSIARLRHLDLSDFLLLGGGSGELELLQFAEHVHIALEFELRSLNKNGYVFGDLLVLERKACFRVNLCDFLALFLVVEIGLDAQLVVLRFELNPLASLFGDCANAVVEFLLALAEDGHVGRLITTLKRLQFTLVQIVPKACELTASLAHDDASENQEGFPLEGTVWVERELTVSFTGLTHGKLGVFVFDLFGLLSFPQVT